MPRIGVLWATVEDSPQANARLLVFRQTLERLGWSEGQNLRIDTRFAIASEASAQVLAKELVALQPEVLLAYSTPMVVALQRETRTIPILFVGVSDPIGSGFIASLARPGGNLTGLSLMAPDLAGKRLELIKSVVPEASRIAMLWNASDLGMAIRVEQAQLGSRCPRDAAFAGTSNACRSRERLCHAHKGSARCVVGFRRSIHHESSTAYRWLRSRKPLAGDL
jgi:hypothetical protein